jgi:type I restriction enzyme M protein
VATLDAIQENDYNLNIPLYVEKIVEDNLPSVDVALAELKEAWCKSLIAEEKFKSILQNYMQINIKEPNIT